MPVGALPFKWRKSHAPWIEAAAKTLVSTFADDLTSLGTGEPWENTMMSIHLPQRYAHRYDLGFAKRVFDTAVVVQFKLGHDEWWTLDTTAEEIVMYALLRRAQDLAREAGRSFTEGAVRTYMDSLYGDTDFEMLFDPRFDGAEDDTDLIERLGIDHLPWGTWFEPFPGHFRRSSD